MNGQSTLADLYKEKNDHFRFKGDRPGESPTTRINELAIIGDASLKLELVTSLVRGKFSNSQITYAISSVLSNAALKEWAVNCGIILSRNAATHASGTLLEALVGYLHLAKSSEKGTDIYIRYQPALESLLADLYTASVEAINANWSVEDLFDCV